MPGAYESIDKTLERRKRMQAAYPEMASATPRTVLEVDAYSTAGNRLPSRLTQDMVRTANDTYSMREREQRARPYPGQRTQGAMGLDLSGPAAGSVLPVGERGGGPSLGGAIRGAGSRLGEVTQAFLDPVGFVQDVEYAGDPEGRQAARVEYQQLQTRAQDMYGMDALEAQYTGSNPILREASRPINYVPGLNVARGLSFAPKANAVVRTALEIGSAAAGVKAGEEVYERTENPYLAAGAGLLAGGAVGVGGARALSGAGSAVRAADAGFVDDALRQAEGPLEAGMDGFPLRTTGGVVDNPVVPGVTPRGRANVRGATFEPGEVPPARVTMADVEALQRKVAAEGMTPENRKALEDAMAYVFRSSDEPAPWSSAAPGPRQGNRVADNLARRIEEAQAPGELQRKADVITEGLSRSRSQEMPDPAAMLRDEERLLRDTMALRGKISVIDNSRLPSEERLSRLEALYDDAVDLGYKNPEAPYPPDLDQLDNDLQGLRQSVERLRKQQASQGTELQGVAIPGVSPSTATGSVLGAASGYASGDTPEERLRNALLGGLAGGVIARGGAATVRQIRDAAAKGETRSFSQWMGDALNVPMSAKSTYDLSAPGRQLAPYLIAHPRAIPRVLRAQFVALGKNPEAYEQSLKALESAPDYSVLKAAGVEFGELGTELTKREEQIASTLAENFLPGAKRFNQAYTSAINEARYLLGSQMLQNIDPSDAAALKRMADLVNASTGRGSLPDLLKQNSLAGIPVFWAPRLLAGRVQLPLMMFSRDANVRNEAIRQVVSFVGVNTALLATADALGIAEVELDPRSADFGVFRIGDRRYDPWAGYKPIANLVARLSYGFAGQDNRRSTNSQAGRGGTYSQSNLDVVTGFLRSKLSPIAGEVVTQKTGTDVTGAEVADAPGGRAGHAAIGLLAPLFLSELVGELSRSFGEGGVSGALQTAAANAPYMMGVGGGYYEPKPEDIAALGGYSELAPDEQFEAIKSEAWRILTEADPALSEYQTSWDWEDAIRKELEAELGDLPAGVRNQVIQSAIDKSSTRKAFTELTNAVETQWVAENPEEARKLWDETADLPWNEGRWTPTRKQQEILAGAQ